MMATQSRQSLRVLLADAPLNTTVCYTSGDQQVQALVTTIKDGFWARLYVGGSAVEGNRIRADAAGLVELLAAAGIPVESGWRPWQAKP